MSKGIIHRHKGYWTDRTSMLSFVTTIIFLLVSLVVNHYANLYVTLRAGHPMADIVLDNIPVINTTFIFVDGALLFIGFIVILLIHDPKKIAFSIKSLAFFYLVRSFFIILTHIGPPQENIIGQVGELGQLFTSVSGADLFFSAHTGLPFLFALIFWRNRFLRYVFLACSVVAAVAVLFGHIHYSIDVASAYFITYGIYCISYRIFRKDHKEFSWNNG